MKISSSMPWLFLFILFVCRPCLADPRGFSDYRRVDELVEKALQNSRELELMNEDIKRSKMELKNAKTSYLPHLYLQGTAGVNLFSVDDFDRDRNLGSNLILDWNFFQNGLVFYRVQQAKAQVELTVLQREKQRIQMAYDIRNLICDLVEKKALLGIVEIEFNLVQRSLEKARLEFKQGKTRRADMMRAETDVFESENTFRRNKAEFQMLERKLRDQTGLDEWELFDGTFEQSVLLLQNKEDLITLGQKQRAEAKEGEIQCMLTKKAVKVAKLGRLPRLDLFAGNAFAIDDFERGTDDFEFRTGVIARYPLYDGGQTKLQIILAEMAAEKADYQMIQLRKKIDQEVEAAYEELLNAKALLDSGQTQYESIRDELGKSEIEFKNGEVSDFDHQEAKRSYERARLHFLSLNLSFYKAEMNLSRVLGFVYVFDATEALSSQTAGVSKQDASSDEVSKS
jgi:outer membrane protein TolC